MSVLLALGLLKHHFTIQKSSKVWIFLFSIPFTPPGKTRFRCYTLVDFLLEIEILETALESQQKCATAHQFRHRQPEAGETFRILQS